MSEHGSLEGITARPPAGFRADVSLLAGVALLALAGCTSTDHGAARAPATNPATATASPTPRPSPTPASPTLRKAADGTHLRRCEDGTCEVKVTGSATIPLDRRKFKVSSVRVVSIRRGAVSFTITSASSVMDVSCENGGCGGELVGTSPPTYHPAGHAGARITANKITVSVVSVAGRSAILRLSPV
ncbi:MAG: hypothetical protein ACRDP6_45035 [Actinoallomurus sp.]